MQGKPSQPRNEAPRETGREKRAKEETRAEDLLSEAGADHMQPPSPSDPLGSRLFGCAFALYYVWLLRGRRSKALLYPLQMQLQERQTPRCMKQQEYDQGNVETKDHKDSSLETNVLIKEEGRKRRGDLPLRFRSSGVRWWTRPKKVFCVAVMHMHTQQVRGFFGCRACVAY